MPPRKKPLNSLDHEEQWEVMKGSVTEGLMEALRVEGKEQSLRPVAIEIDDKLDRNDIASQKAAKIAGKTWGVPVRGTFEIVDPKGQVIRKQKMKLLDLPKLTPRHSYIINGTEYQIKNEFRLRPGIYTRVKRTGELESQFNLARRLNNFRLHMNPETARYKVKFGTSNVDLLPVLEILGITDREAREALGDDVWNANILKVNRDRDIRKIYRAVFRKQAPASLDETMDILRDYLLESKLDPETTQITLGKSFENVTGEAILRAARKILDINRGEVDPDDRDEMRFKQLLTPDDLVKERIIKGSQELTSFKRRMTRHIDRYQDARSIIRPDDVKNLIINLFNRSRNTEVPKQLNSLEMISNFAKTTLMGEGGIKERNAITLGARNISPTQTGFIDPIHTPEGDSIGVTSHLAVGVSKRGDEVTTRFINARTGEPTDLNPVQMFASVIAFPDQYEISAEGFAPISDRVKAMRGGKPVMISPTEVDYIIASPVSLFDVSVNLLPFLGSLQGGRAMMAAKMQEQAVSLVNREPPLVQVKVADNIMEDVIGRASQVPLSPVAGEITQVTDTVIQIRDNKGKIHKVQLYKNFPLNAKSFLESDPLVIVGDRVKKGDPLADSTFTRDGKLALGKPLLTAFLPAKGWNYEDGIVISETAAKKLTSQHIHKTVVPILKNTVLDLEKFKAYFPSRFSVDEMAHLDSQGVTKEGSVLSKGMPIITYIARVEVTPEEAIAGKLRRSLIQPYHDRTVTWEEDVLGEVVEVHKSKKRIIVLTKTLEPAVLGDKLANRSANKGIITRILPDNEMPHLEDGTPVEILLSPSGIPSRINPSQVLELAASKIAQTRGAPFIVESFRPIEESNLNDVQRALGSVGISDKEELYDPNTGKPLVSPVSVGPLYTLKLAHPATEKFSARSTGPAFGYTMDETPARGHGKSGQSIDHLTLYSVMASGARENLREMARIKGGRNDEWWRAWMARETLPTPQQGLPFERFESLMKGMGVNLARKGDSLQLTPMTDKETMALSRGAIRHGRLLMGKDLRPERGGLFDPEVTGGHGGKGFAHIELSDTLPHPVFETALRTILDISQKDYFDIVSGGKTVDPETGELLGPGEGLHGGAGIAALLGRIDIDAELERLSETAAIAKDHQLNKINKKIRFLKNYQELNLSPTDLVLTKLPVIPPRFRPIYPLDSGDLVNNSLNKLYKDVITVNEKLEELDSLEAPAERLIEKRRDLYNASKAVMGLGNPITYANIREQGIFDTIKGRTNKRGLFQDRILKRRQDLTGRGVLTLDPALHVDEVGIPEDMAWEIFEPFIVREMVGLGRKPLEAKAAVKQRTPDARDILFAVARQRLVFINRSPSLHKHSVVAFKPQLIQGQVITMHPLNLRGLSADVDGDTLAVHVPVTEPALQEARKLLPSRNILSVSEDLLLAPSQDIQAGLFLVTRGTTERDISFDSNEEALGAYKRGEIRIDDIVDVAGISTTPGRLLVNKSLPVALKDPNLILDKRTTKKILTDLARNNPAAAPGVIDVFKDLGRQFSYDLGFSIGVEDLKMDLGLRDSILADADNEVDALPADLTDEELEQRMIGIYQNAQNRLDDSMRNDLLAKDNPFAIMAESGARGNWDQVRQITAAPIFYTDALNQIIPYPVKKSFGEGLDMSDYWTSLYGARRGHIEKSVQTAAPGALNKSLIGTTIETVITSEDCGTSRGLRLPLNDPRVPGRYLAQPAGSIDAGERLVGAVISRLERDGATEVIVRSPIYCEDPQGVCRICWGHDSNGQLLDVGHPVGIMSSQAITEPLTQLTMSSFHTGGISKKDADLADNFTAIKQLLELPKTFRGKATLARKTGTITNIEPSIAGGFNVNVDDDTHFIPPGRNLLEEFDVGSTVEKGTPISDGFIYPLELMKLKGPYAARENLAESLDNIYRNAKKTIPARHFETVARSVLNATRIRSGDGGFIPGDISPIDTVQAENLKPENIRAVSTEEALGSALAEEIPEIGEIGKILDEEDLIRLAELGYEQFQANPNPIVHEPVIKGIGILPRTRRDWMSHLAFRNLGEVIQRGVPEGWTSPVVSIKPLPPYLYGSI